MNVLVTEPELQYGSVNFLVYLFNSFEQVPVPGVTENRYLAVRRTRGWLSEGRNLVGRSMQLGVTTLLTIKSVRAHKFHLRFQ